MPTERRRQFTPHCPLLLATWREEAPGDSSAPRPLLGHSHDKPVPPVTRALHTSPAPAHCSGFPLPALIPGSCLILSVPSAPGGPSSTLTPIGSGKPSPRQFPTNFALCWGRRRKVGMTNTMRKRPLLYQPDTPTSPLSSPCLQASPLSSSDPQMVWYF